MTWLIDARTLASRPTGIGMYAKRHIVRLQREETAARFVLVCDVRESAEIRELEALGMEVLVYGKRVFNSTGVLGYFRFVRRVVAVVKPDVFWQPNNVQPFRPKGVGRVIVTMHDVFGLKEWSWRYAVWHLYCRLSFWRTLRNVTEIWFNSRETESAVRAAVPRQLAQLTAKVVYPITEVPAREAVTPYESVRPFFLYVGNIEFRKGADILISAYVRYRQKALAVGREPFDLVFAGIEKNIQVPCTDGIVVLGYVSEQEKFSLMCSCVAMVVPSRAEGYGMQVAEAAALGVRCIASDLSVFHEIDATRRETFRVGDFGELSERLVGVSLMEEVDGGADRAGGGYVYMKEHRDGTDEVKSLAV